MSKTISKSKLARLMRASVSANNKAHLASSNLDSFCEENYGLAPSDIDCESIIDDIYGALGLSEGELSPEEFHEEMKKSFKMVGKEFPNIELGK